MVTLCHLLERRLEIFVDSKGKIHDQVRSYRLNMLDNLVTLSFRTLWWRSEDK